MAPPPPRPRGGREALAGREESSKRPSCVPMHAPFLADCQSAAAVLASRAPWGCTAGGMTARQEGRVAGKQHMTRREFRLMDFQSAEATLCRLSSLELQRGARAHLARVDAGVQWLTKEGRRNTFEVSSQ
jgi:hypothetical protein